jgi:organic hydroperoxide reductase OsmC/OhrA
MALAIQLDHAGTPASRLEVTCACVSERVGDSSRVTALKLLVRGRVAGLCAGEFARICEEARANCSISIALGSGACISLDRQLA